ncbi:MAG: archaeosortase/exosortase family protein [Candidatus Eisenbacteria bacterium]|nr:archaeosortase/exosortase family protein [Candidatus Eisenbacteria bacterium]
MTQTHKEKRKSPSPKRQVARFLIVFFGLWAILWAVPYVLGTFPPGVERLCTITAAWLGGILSLLGFHTAVSGAFVGIGSTGVTIIAECTGYTAMALFLSVVVAYPSSIAAKLIGLAVGIPLILGFNMLRLVVMAVVLAYRPQYFEFAHLYFWQVALIIFVVAIVIFWIQKLVNREKPLSVSS